tara:strand:+ start:483 stop:650 length:168 start_codon:yes stop_codon:yes gene_type:complete
MNNKKIILIKKRFNGVESIISDNSYEPKSHLKYNLLYMSILLIGYALILLTAINL